MRMLALTLQLNFCISGGWSERYSINASFSLQAVCHTPAYNDQPIKEWQKLYIAATVWGL